MLNITIWKRFIICIIRWFDRKYVTLQPETAS